MFIRSPCMNNEKERKCMEMSDIGALVAHGLECSQILKSRRLNIIQTKADLLKKSEEMRKEATKQQENLIKSKQVRYQHKILSFK